MELSNPAQVFAEDFDFSKSLVYRKTSTIPVSNVKKVAQRTQVITKIDAFEETKNVANPGDFIVTGFKGEQYVIRGDRFYNLYELDSSGSNYISKNQVRARVLKDSSRLFAPWGEMQVVRAGGYICQSCDEPKDVYLVDKEVFENTYAPLGVA